MSANKKGLSISEDNQWFPLLTSEERQQIPARDSQ